MRLVLPLALVVAMASGGCFWGFGCEPEGAWGTWRQPGVYTAVRGMPALAGDPTHWQGGIPTGEPLAFDDPAFEAAHQGDAWLAYVTWWPDTDRRYLMRGAAPADDGAPPAQAVLLEADWLTAGTFDAAEAAVFLDVVTALDAPARDALAERWLNQSSADATGRLREIVTNVTLDLPAAHRSLGLGWRDASAQVEDGPQAGHWQFAFSIARVSWRGATETGTASLMVWADGQVHWSYASTERPGTRQAYLAAAHQDFAALALPEPTFEDLTHRRPVDC